MTRSLTQDQLKRVVGKVVDNITGVLAGEADPDAAEPSGTPEAPEVFMAEAAAEAEAPQS